MQISIEQTSNLGRKLHITVPAQEIDEKTTNKLNELKGKVDLKGFRKGKVPLVIMKQRFGKSARSEVIADTIQATYIDAITKEKLKPAGYPKIDPKESVFGEPLEYIAVLEVLPEIELASLDGVKLEREIAELTEKDVDNMLEKLRKQSAKWKEVTRPAKNDDQLLIDFTGTIKGEEFKGGSAKDFKFELGAGAMLEDFEKSLKGAKPGDELKFKVKFPKDYTDANVAGKKAEFVVTVHKVLEPELPEMNDEFLATVGIKEGGVEKLREQMKTNMANQLDQSIKSKFKNAIFDKLLELHTIELPEVLIDEEIARLQQQAKQQYARYFGKDAKDIPDVPRENFIDEAKKRVRLGLLIAEFIKVYEIKPDKDKVKELVNNMAASYEKPEEVVNWYYQNKRNLAEIESQVLEDQALEIAKEKLTIVEKKFNFDDFMKPKSEKE